MLDIIIQKRTLLLVHNHLGFD